MTKLCDVCEYSRMCSVWGETKCVKLKQRIYNTIESCPDFKRRPKNFVEPKCQCEDCMSRGVGGEE